MTSTLHLPKSVLLKYLKDTTEIRRSAEAHLQTVSERQHTGIKMARMAGVDVPAIGEATGLSVSRVHSIIGATEAMRVVTDEEIEQVLKYAPDVVIVPAGWVGYPEYRQYDAYVCQRGRAFKGDPKRMGFYFHKAVMPEITLIVHVRDHVEFTPEHVTDLRERGEEHDEEVATLIERMLTNRARSVGFVGKIFLLSPHDDEDRTLVLPWAIQHKTTGPGTGFVRKHRYVSEGALKKHPKTTAELLEYDGMPVQLPWSDDASAEAGA